VLKVNGAPDVVNVPATRRMVLSLLLPDPPVPASVSAASKLAALSTHVVTAPAGALSTSRIATDAHMTTRFRLPDCNICLIRVTKVSTYGRERASQPDKYYAEKPAMRTTCAPGHSR